jgi:hypothetical protein
MSDKKLDFSTPNPLELHISNAELSYTSLVVLGIEVRRNNLLYFLRQHCAKC